METSSSLLYACMALMTLSMLGGAVLVPLLPGLLGSKVLGPTLYGLLQSVISITRHLD